MFKAKFILKNAVTINVSCKNLKVKTNELTGEIIQYEIEGIEGEKPVYINISEIVAITAKEIPETRKEVRVYGLQE